MPAITIERVFLLFIIIYCINKITMSERLRSIINAVIAVVLFILFFVPVK